MFEKPAPGTFKKKVYTRNTSKVIKYLYLREQRFPIKGEAPESSARR